MGTFVPWTTPEAADEKLSVPIVSIYRDALMIDAKHHSNELRSNNLNDKRKDP
jgi:hypothetical protein